MNLLQLFESLTPTIRWKMPRNSEHYVSVWIDVAKVDASWHYDKGFYIHPNGEGAIKGRLERFAQWLKLGEPVEMPEVSLGFRNEITFGNGRHRFRYLADRGVSKMPVCVDTDNADEIKKRFGV